MICPNIFSHKYVWVEDERLHRCVKCGSPISGLDHFPGQQSIPRWPDGYDPEYDG